MQIADGGGGSQYSAGTQRENLAFIASTQLADVESAQQAWTDTADQAAEVGDLVVRRLEELTAEGGWTGSGAEAFAAMIMHDLVEPLRRYEQTARRNAKNYQPLARSVLRAHGTATYNNIPWDVDTRWFVTRKDIEQGLLSKLDEAVTGEDEDYEKAKANAPYEIKRGNDALVKSVAKERWDAIETMNPMVPAPAVFTRVGSPVSAEQHRFDRMMEAEQLNSAAHANVSSAAHGISDELFRFSPEPVEKTEFAGGKYQAQLPGGQPGAPGGPGTGGPGTGGPGTGGPGPGSGGPVPSGPGDGPGDRGPGDRGPDDGGWDGPERPDRPDLPDRPDDGPGDLIGPGDPGTSTTGPVTGGPDLPIADLPGQPGDGYPGGTDPGALPGGPGADVGGIGGPGGVEARPVSGAEVGTSAAGVAPIGAPTAPAAPVTGGAMPSMPTGAPAGGAGGLGALPMASAGGGAPGTSFSIGAGGRPSVMAGAHGALPGSPGGGAGGIAGGPGATGTGSGAGPGGAGGSGTGANAAGQGPAGGPMARRGQSSEDEDEQQTELDGTWLEEEESVWGARSSAPPSEIR